LFPDFADRKYLAGAFGKTQRGKKTERRKKLDTEQSKKNHHQPADNGLQRQCDSLDQGHPQRSFECCLLGCSSLLRFAGRQPHRNEGNVEQMKSESLKCESIDYEQTGTVQNQPHCAADQAARKEKSLQHSDLGPEQHANEQQDRQYTEKQKRRERKRAMHKIPCVVFPRGYAFC